MANVSAEVESKGERPKTVAFRMDEKVWIPKQQTNLDMNKGFGREPLSPRISLSPIKKG